MEDCIFITENFKKEHTRCVIFERYNPFLSYTLLTDFCFDGGESNKYWTYPIPNEESLKNAIDVFNNEKKIVYGELGINKTVDITCSKFSHTIENIFLKDNKIYGLVKILDNDNGSFVKETSKLFDIKFFIRAMGRVQYRFEKDETIIDSIITWDIDFK